MLTRHNYFEKMDIYAEVRIEILKKYIKLENEIPHKDIIKRVVAIIDPNVLNLIFYQWLAHIVASKNNKYLKEINRIVASDGKTICGSDDIYNKDLHILTAFDTENELVLGQLTVNEKTNEIKVMPELIDLTDLIVTADTLNCQEKTSNAIVGKGGNYVLAVKGNKELLYDDIKDYFDDKTIDSIIAKDELYKKTSENLNTGEVSIEERFNVEIDLSKYNFEYNTGIIGTADKAVVMWKDYLELKNNNIKIADYEAAVAYICKANNVECIIIKGISDFPEDETGKDKLKSNEE